MQKRLRLTQNFKQAVLEGFEEVVEDSLTEKSVRFCKGFILTYAKLRDFKPRYSFPLKFQSHDSSHLEMCPLEQDEERLLKRKERMMATEAVPVIPSVEHKVPQEQISKWMSLITWTAKCVPMSCKPVCVKLNQALVIRIECKSVTSEELDLLRQDANFGEIRLFTQNGVIVLILEVLR